MEHTRVAHGKVHAWPLGGGKDTKGMEVKKKITGERKHKWTIKEAKFLNGRREKNIHYRLLNRESHRLINCSRNIDARAILRL